MRLKVRLTVQREVLEGTVLQQSFVVEFIVRNQQCVDCQAVFRQGSWKSLVQVRQRVSHKRTFLYLEQLILKHGAHRGCLSIEAFRDGMDFYFPDKGKAARFISFLENVVPVRMQTSKKLISTDCKSNIANFKYTNLVEICPLCKDDLVYLPAKLARSLGNISRLVLVKNISNLIHLQDPLSGQTAGLTNDAYWRNEGVLRPLITAARSRLTRYVVLGKEPVVLRANVSKRRTPAKTKSRLARIILAREDDLGARDACHVDELSHLGYLLKAGDVCVGYDLKDTQLVDDEAEAQRSQGKLPDVIVVRKLYGGAAAAAIAGDDATSSAAQQRIWRLQRLEVDVTNTMETNRRGGAAKAKVDEMDVDEEDFMQEVEADREMRQNINLYRSGLAKKPYSMTTSDNENEDAVEDDDDQQVKLDELLDGLALDATPDVDLPDPPLNAEDDHLEFEEGRRALRDGISYVDREAARSVRGKEVAIHVPRLDDGFLQQHKKTEAP
jgi:nonsense-mediated mRNA decay protein 3